MKSLSFVFKNIKNFFLHHTVMFFFLIIVQIICCVSVFIVCGMANNMYYVEDTGSKATDDNIYFRVFSLGFEGTPSHGITQVFDSETGEAKAYYTDENDEISEFVDYSNCPTVAELRPSFDKLSSALGDDFAFANVFMAYNEKLYIKDVDKLPSTVVSVVPGKHSTALGETFEHSSENIFSGDKEKYKNGDVLTLNNIKYSYVETTSGGCAIPYNSLQDDFRVYGVGIILTELPTPQRRTEIQNIINDIFEMNIYFSEIPETYEPTERQISQMVYIISLIVMVIILFALAKFYSYVLSNRQNALTVLRLCGGTKRQIHLIYMIEIFLTMIVTSALGFVVFKYLCYQPIAEMYPSFDVFFTPDIYIIITTAYILLALIIMAITIIPATKASIIDMKRG